MWQYNESTNEYWFVPLRQTKPVMKIDVITAESAIPGYFDPYLDRLIARRKLCYPCNYDNTSTYSGSITQVPDALSGSSTQIA